MIQDAKALIVVLVLTAPIWYFAKRLFAPLSAPGDFERRRNVWIFLTVVGMLAPNIWLYAFFALPVAYWAGRRDSNPVAVYLLLFYVVPNASVPLPSIIVNQLFDINNQRLLALAIILPAVLQARRLRFSEPGLASAPRRRLDAMDWLLISYLLLTLILPFPYESITNTMRRALLALLDVGLLFAVWSRLNPRYEVFRDCMGAWVLAALMMSMVAMFETARGWLLYVPIAERWGAPNVFAYLLRGGLLRAQATAGHSLTLGIWLAIAWTLFLFIQSSWKSRLMRVVFGLVLLGGLAASMARGAWMAALVATVIYQLLNPKGAVKAVKALGGLSVALVVFLVSPLGDRFMSLLPFVGNVDSENVEYRKRLLDVSLDLIGVNPWFGDPFVLRQMESLRQGQGIIDLVNGYLTVALFNGLVGLALFAGFLIVGVRRGIAVWRSFKKEDQELAFLGASLVAAMLGTMLFIATAGIDPMTYMLAGLLSSYWWMWRLSRKRGGAPGLRQPPAPTSAPAASASGARRPTRVR